MKARVFKVIKNNDYRIKYTYVDAAKYHDDVEACHHCYFNTPMMEIRIFRDNDSLEEETMIVFASPEIIKEFTGFDMFDAYYSFSIDRRVIDIDFEWVEGNYPYLKTDDRRDKILTDKYRYPKINKIEEADLNL